MSVWDPVVDTCYLYSQSVNLARKLGEWLPGLNRKSRLTGGAKSDKSEYGLRHPDVFAGYKLKHSDERVPLC